MRNNTLVMLGASVAFGALAVIMARGWIKHAVEQEFDVSNRVALAVPTVADPKTSDLQPVLVAAHDVAFGDTLTRSSFRVVELPAKAVPENTYQSLDDVFGELSADDTIRALSDMRALEPVFAERISGPGAKASLSARIRDGYVGASIAVDPVTGVGGHVVPGDLVDVVLITQPDAEEQPELFHTDIVLQAVRVLGIDQNAATETEGAEVARTVTLEVDRRDVQVLALGAETGTLSLALRGAGERDFVTSASLRSDQLGGANRTSLPKPKPRSRAPRREDGRTSVKIVRGDAVQSVRVRREPNTQSADAATGYLAGGR